jgi:transposase-like protein
MDSKFVPIEKIRSSLDQLRQDPNTRRKFPRELWASIIHLTKTYPVEEVCRRLQIHPVYLKRKIHQSKEPALEFREIVMPAVQSAPDTVTIELRSADGLQAKIQGPSSCLNYLSKLFRG